MKGNNVEAESMTFLRFCVLLLLGGLTVYFKIMMNAISFKLALDPSNSLFGENGTKLAVDYFVMGFSHSENKNIALLRKRTLHDSTPQRRTLVGESPRPKSFISEREYLEMNGMLNYSQILSAYVNLTKPPFSLPSGMGLLEAFASFKEFFYFPCKEDRLFFFCQEHYILTWNSRDKSVHPFSPSAGAHYAGMVML